MKTCSKCKLEKELTEFHKDATKKDGLCHQCKECARARINGKRAADPEAARLRECAYRKANPTKYKHVGRKSKIYRQYGLSLAEYQQMFIEQDHRCAICRTHQDDLDRTLFVDHCHETGVVRGLLCYKCNTGLGNFKDDLSLVQRAGQYLQKVGA